MYHVSPEITCTIETYMGTRLQLNQLDHTTAERFGSEIGGLMHGIHHKKTHIIGTGELSWDGANLYGVSPDKHPVVMRRIEQSYRDNILSTLVEHAPPFDHRLVREKLYAANALRDLEEPVVLINRDVTPENLTLQANGHLGVIDPYVYLGNGTRPYGPLSRTPLRSPRRHTRHHRGGLRGRVRPRQRAIATANCRRTVALDTGTGV
jgi:hypothetical protein